MLVNKKISLIECPRDAMQGWKHFIPTQTKIDYINALLKVGFNTLDFGSFVSPKAIPQMADTAQVLAGIDKDSSSTKLLAIVANLRGAKDALMYDKISYLGVPFSISPTFQIRNTNSTIDESFKTVAEIQNLCFKKQQQLVVYISMGFGNIYGDLYNEEIVQEWVEKLIGLGIKIISMADTVGLATDHQVGNILSTLIAKYPGTEIGVHLHSTAENWKPKVDAALKAGCTRFDGALKGIGGCPMANDVLVGNMDTELMIPYFNQLNLLNNLDIDALNECSKMAAKIFV